MTFHGGIACARATKKLRPASNNKPQITLITIRLIERTGHDRGHESHRDHKLRHERRQCRFPDLPRRATVFRLFGHVDAESIGHGIGNRNGHNAADDNGS